MRSTDQRLTLLPVRSITSSTQARFNAINTDFVGVMEKVDRDPRVMSLAKGGADVLSRLEAMEDQLGVCPFPLRSLAIRCTVATRRSRTCSRAHTSTRTHTHTHTHTHPHPPTHPHTHTPTHTHTHTRTRSLPEGARRVPGAKTVCVLAILLYRRRGAYEWHALPRPHYCAP
jgi:hypothetical protein